jgi:enterobacterial common antigen flippase
LISLTSSTRHAGGPRAGSPRAKVLPFEATAAYSYGQILKSTVLIGGSSIVNITLGMVRTKVMALLLGPAGVGLWGLYGAIADLTGSLAGLGISSSGVRQIAEAVGSGNRERVARTVSVLRRTSMLLGVVAALLLAIFSAQISMVTFGTDAHAVAVGLLAIAVFLRLVASGQLALIQGMRRVADLARAGVWAGLFGTAISVAAVYLWLEDGLVPSLIGIAGGTIVTSWWYSRRIPTAAPSMSTSEAWQEAAALLKLGFAFLASAFMTMGVAYAVRITVLHVVGFEAAGLYQAAWTLGGLYVGFILQAMGADFYPRLTAVGGDNIESNRLVNEQAQMGLLLAGPGVVATLTFAQAVVALLYSTSFAPAADLLRWICLGMMLRIISWPMGFIILARAEQKLFFVTELAWTIIHIALAWACVTWYGLNGAGMAFFGSYIFHSVLIYIVVRRLTGFRWSRENRRAGLLFLVLIAAAFFGFASLPGPLDTGVGVLALALSTAYSVRTVSGLVALERCPPSVRRVLEIFGSVSLGARR